jgi:hypothetical protein
LENIVIENPWHGLPDEPPYVLSDDREKVLAFNVRQKRKENQNGFLHLDLIPEPFVGKPDAPVVLLGTIQGLRTQHPLHSGRNKHLFSACGITCCTGCRPISVPLS